jgi:hypothetical protein
MATKTNRFAVRQKSEERNVKTLFIKLQKAESVPFPKRRQPVKATNAPGVYIILSKSDRVLHVGRTLRGDHGLRQRLYGHLNGQSSFVSTFLKGNKSRLRKGYKYKLIEVMRPRQRALLEHYAIGVLCPAHLGLGLDLARE